MILVIFIWIIVTFIMLMTGFSFVRILSATHVINHESSELSFDDYFFSGFLILSAFAAILSIFFPIGFYFLIFISILALVSLFVWIHDFMDLVRGFIFKISSVSLTVKLLFVILFSLVLTATAHPITFYDAGLYHEQSIKWIRELPVVPGLGNLHSRLAFNSMFFVISAPFTFEYKDILIYPLNGLSFVILLSRLFSLFKYEVKKGNNYKALLYGLLALTSFFILLPDLNSPAPDIICGILIIYLFTLIINYSEEQTPLKTFSVILINMLIFSCISFKLSSLFIFLSIFLILKKNFLWGLSTSIIIGIVFLVPFLIRNYYLSGYLIYPFPSIDIFKVEWKIPMENLLVDKLSIESWAKIPGASFSEVNGLKITEWILPWFKSLYKNSIVLIIPNVLSFITLFIMIKRKDYFTAFLQAIIIVNLIFWFSNAPDPRFVHGFLITGFSLTIFYFIKLLTINSLNTKRIVSTFLMILFILVVFQRREYPIYIITNPEIILRPDKLMKIKTSEYSENFIYRTPKEGDQCYNAEIPCTPFPIQNVFMRSENIKDGFKVVK